MDDLLFSVEYHRTHWSVWWWKKNVIIRILFLSNVINVRYSIQYCKQEKVTKILNISSLFNSDLPGRCYNGTDEQCRVTYVVWYQSLNFHNVKVNITLFDIVYLWKVIESVSRIWNPAIIKQICSTCVHWITEDNIRIDGSTVPVSPIHSSFSEIAQASYLIPLAKLPMETNQMFIFFIPVIQK